MNARSVHKSRNVKVGDYVTIEYDRGKPFLRKCHGTATMMGVVVVDKHDIVQKTLYLLEHDTKYTIEIDGYLVKHYQNGGAFMGGYSTTTGR